MRNLTPAARKSPDDAASFSEYFARALDCEPTQRRSHPDQQILERELETGRVGVSMRELVCRGTQKRELPVAHSPVAHAPVPVPPVCAETRQLPPCRRLLGAGVGAAVERSSEDLRDEGSYAATPKSGLRRVEKPPLRLVRRLHTRLIASLNGSPSTLRGSRRLLDCDDCHDFIEADEVGRVSRLERQAVGRRGRGDEEIGQTRSTGSSGSSRGGEHSTIRSGRL